MGNAMIFGGARMKKPSVGLELSSLMEGQIVNINEDDYPIPFYLAKHNYEEGLNGAGRTLLVRYGANGKRAWHSSEINAYATSDIDTWLNGDYKARLDKVVQDAIGVTKFYYTAGGSSLDVSTLNRSVFLLSATELGIDELNLVDVFINKEGSKLPIADILRIAYYGPSKVDQWTRSIDIKITPNVCHVGTTGTTINLYRNDATQKFGSRPCFTLPETMLVNPEPNADGSVNLIY